MYYIFDIIHIFTYEKPQKISAFIYRKCVREKNSEWKIFWFKFDLIPLLIISVHLLETNKIDINIDLRHFGFFYVETNRDLWRLRILPGHYFSLIQHLFWINTPFLFREKKCVVAFKWRYFSFSFLINGIATTSFFDFKHVFAWVLFIECQHFNGWRVQHLLYRN